MQKSFLKVGFESKWDAFCFAIIHNILILNIACSLADENGIPTLWRTSLVVEYLNDYSFSKFFCLISVIDAVTRRRRGHTNVLCRP